jgi:hypothetical protein
LTGRDDAAAAEAAQLHALHRRAEERRQELAETLDALTAQLATGTDVRTLARRGARLATSRLSHATAEALRGALPSVNGTGTAARRVSASRQARSAAVAVAVPGTLAAIAAWWWWRSTRRRGRQSPLWAR